MSIATERQEQAALFEWAEWAANQYPELELLHAIPNGQMRRGMAMEPGLREGVPDVFLPVPRYSKATKEMYNGLYIELKRAKGGRLSAAQSWWLERLQEQGYHAVVCRGAEAAINVIERYLEAS